MIYDIFHNGEELVIVCPYHTKPIVNWDIIQCTHRNTTLYIKKAPYNDTVLINNKIYDVKTYPSFKDEIIMATCVKDSDNYIIQWIEFHRKLGVTRFIVYDNSGISSKTYTFLRWYIKLGIVVIIPWKWKFFSEKSQETQQAHAVNAFKTARYIGLLDIDEYVVSKTQLTQLFEADCTHGGYCLRSKFFYNSDNAPENNYEFLKIYSCEEHPRIGEYEKAFVSPKNMRIFCIHKVSVGKPVIYRNDIHMNHYIFLNKPNRGRNTVNGFDDSIKLMYPSLFMSCNNLTNENKNLYVGSRKELYESLGL